MDLSPYIKKSLTHASRNSGSRIEKRCLNCGKYLDNEGDYLFRQSFCSAECKAQYIGK
ncbi:MAG: hypothetical protein Q7S21_01480 [archaeon]|nr:hypothetical protein [archaeon]